MMAKEDRDPSVSLVSCAPRRGGEGSSGVCCLWQHCQAQPGRMGRSLLLHVHIVFVEDLLKKLAEALDGGSEWRVLWAEAPADVA